MDSLNAVAPEFGCPEELTQPPRSLGELIVGEPSASFQHADLVSLLGQPQRTDAAAEARADDEYVVIRFHRSSMARGACAHAPTVQTNFVTYFQFSSCILCSLRFYLILLLPPFSLLFFVILLPPPLSPPLFSSAPSDVYKRPSPHFFFFPPCSAERGKG